MAETAAEHNKEWITLCKSGQKPTETRIRLQLKNRGNAQTTAVVTEPYSYLTAC